MSKQNDRLGSRLLEYLGVDHVDRVLGIECVDLVVDVGELEVPLVFRHVPDVRSGNHVGVLDVVTGGVDERFRLEDVEGDGAGTTGRDRGFECAGFDDAGP